MHFSSRDLAKLARNPRAVMAMQSGNVALLDNMVEQFHVQEKRSEFQRFFYCMERKGTKIPTQFVINPTTPEAHDWFSKNLPDASAWEWYKRIYRSH